MKRILISTVLGVVMCAVFGITAFAQAPSREELLQELETKHTELLNDLKRIEKQLLLPSEEDQLAFAEFLTQPDTGLVRLLPREVYDSNAHPEKRLGISGGGSYYSFTRQTHEYGRGTQIGLEQGRLHTSFAGADYGMITNLGDVPLETLTLEHANIKSLVSYERASDEPRARAEYQRFMTGDSIGGAVYKTTLPATVNNSYVLRGIHYSDSDVLVAFRIVRKDSDGSLIILWKLLKKNTKPELARASEPGN
jgi:hypothetical protein